MTRLIYGHGATGHGMEKKSILLTSGILFLLLPWYYTDSGQPQPVDVIILLLGGIFAFLKVPYFSQIVHYAKLYRLFLFFSLYSTIILLIDFIVDIQTVTLYLILQNLYYIFLVSIFLLTIYYLYQKYNFEKYYKILLYFLLVDSVIPFYYLLKLGAFTYRISLSFNNPNQLGFFAIVNFSLFFYAALLAKEQKIKPKRILSLLIINLNLIFIFLSSSRACYPAIVLYVLSYPFIFNFKLRGYSYWLFWSIACLILSSAVFSIGYKLYTHMLQSRISRLPTNYNDLSYDIYFRAARGISYNFNDIWYFIFGNGTYTTIVRGNLEFHNNFLAMFNQIGIIGLFFYFYMNFIIVKGLFKKGILYFFPYFCYLFYSMFQYSYRTRLNWLLIAMIIFIFMHDSIRSNRKSYNLRSI